MQVDKLAADWMVQFKVQWPEQVRQQKLKVFTDNLWRVSRINTQSSKQGWWAATNKFADLTDQEFADLYLFKQDYTVPPIAKIGINRIIKLATGWDWSTLGNVTAVKDQGGVS